MRIRNCRSTVGGPTGVTDSGFACQRFMNQQIRQVHQFSHRPATVELTFVDCGYACAVISPVLKTLQRFDQNRSDFVLSEDPDNSTHD
jgi:hypothetical protein